MSDPLQCARSGISGRAAHLSRCCALVALILIASMTLAMPAADSREQPAATEAQAPQKTKEMPRERRAAPREKAEEKVTPEQIDAAIQKGVAYIYSQQKPDGRWEEMDHRTGIAHDWEKTQGDTFGGFSALATYALLTADEKPDDKRVVSAISFLKKADVIGIYSLGLRAQVWHLLARDPKEKEEMADLATKDADRIVNNINTTGDNRGLWDYGTGKGKRIDHSVSQYGILGLWALQEAGANVDIRFWHVFDERWRADQLADGSWSYDATPQHKGTHPRSAAMTAAGIATLFITQDNTYADLPDHHGNLFNSNIENGLRWMAEHFKEVGTNYGWYGVERIGVASGTKYFGTIDWFQKGAEHLIATQAKDGSWPTEDPGGTHLTDTCFAVLFLARGRAPIMMNKVQYEIAAKNGKPEEADWNERPRDVANLAQWTGDRVEGNFNWQLVNLKVTAEELRDAPILYFAGDQALNFTEAEEDKLKIFVREGGMILANADYSNKLFTDSVMTLGTKMFGYEFRELESNSPIWTENGRVARGSGKVLALSNGIREMMIILNSGDPAKVWQTPPNTPRSEPMALGANIFLYAVDKKNLESRGQSTLVLPNFAVKTERTIAVARLKYGGNWDPEPGGWWRVAAIFHNDFHVDLEVKPVSLGKGELTAAPRAAVPPRPSKSEIRKMAFKRIPPDQVQGTEGDPDKLNALLQPKIAEVESELDAAAEAARRAAVGSLKIAHLTGTTKFVLSDEQFDELQKFINGGGTLIIDSGGGSPDFSNSAEELLKKLLPDEAAKALQVPLPPDDPLYTLKDHAITEVRYRTFARTVVGNLRSARVFGIPVNGRIAVYYSPEDISGGLVGQPTDGIVGYSPDTATDIMRNIILATAK